MKIPKFQDLILFENDEVIVVNKPPYFSSLDDRAGESTNMLRMGKQYAGDVQLCHRLDKETSGALIFAKNPDSYRSISMQFEHREVKKIYHAIVDGQHKFQDLYVDLPIAIGAKGQVRIDKAEGKRAETYFSTLELYKHYTLMECRPLTGRMHQIRIHLATQRASITGDDMYGGKPMFLSKIKRSYKQSSEETELPILKRFALHAFSVSFKLLNGEEISINAPYPKDFGVAKTQLDKFDKI